MPSASDRQLLRAWRGLGDLLIILLQIDEISNSRPIIRQHWNSYMRALTTAHHNPTRFGYTSDELRSLIASVAGIEEYIMAGNALRNCYEKSYGALDDDATFASRMYDTIIEMTNLYEEQSDAMLDEAITHVELADEWQDELRMEIRKPEPRDAATSLKMADLVLKGSRIADTMCRLLKTVLNSHNGPLQMSKRTAYSVFKIIETIKAISQNFSIHWRSLLESCQMACQQWRCHSLNLLDKAKSHLSDSSDTERLAALQIAIDSLLSTCIFYFCIFNMYSGLSASRNRLSVCGVALEVAQYKKIMRGTDTIQLDGLLNRLETLCRPRDLVDRVTNCSFLFFHRDLIDIYWDTLADRMPSTEYIGYFMFALSDCIFFVTRSQYDNHFAAGTILQDHIYESIKKGFLIPLCGAIENDLRVLTHKHLEVDERDKTPKEKADFYRHILRKPEIRLKDYIINIKDFVTRYLEKTFYNLTAVALHDYHAYSKMAVLAEQRWELFAVIKYYRFKNNSQIFIEKQSPNRSLRVLTADHMANSLQTHGMGVLNTSVNITYQLLRKKFAIFNQFLANEHIHAQLQKDIRYFDENRENLRKMFPVKRAEKFNRAVSKLGVLDSDETYMDKFRSLITQIGNALGFVRSLVSGAASVVNQMKEYDVLEGEPFTSNLSQGMNIVYKICVLVDTESTESPITTVCHLLDELRSQTKRNRNYIKMLIDVFRDGFKNHERFAHLTLFYMIIPALTMNYVDHMLTCRDRLKKRTQHNVEMTFTDDGFVLDKFLSYILLTNVLFFFEEFILGLAYLVTVLDVWPQFSALNWFRSMSKIKDKFCGTQIRLYSIFIIRKYEADLAQLNEEMKSTKDSRGAHLKSARLQANEKVFMDVMKKLRKEQLSLTNEVQEYKLLSFTFQSARVFFSVDEDAE
uniref:MYND-type domain-containing protein n=1 Tax=Heterorhabditis bacteriophora TaxID=37862 RepID=A0A1I7XQL9_HETBA